MSQLNHLCAAQWEDLMNQIIEYPNIKLTDWEIERIIWETTPSERKWLEDHLPSDHIIIQEYALNIQCLYTIIMISQFFYDSLFMN